MSNYPRALDAANDHHSAQVVQIEALGRGGIAAVLMVGVLGIILGCIGIGYAGRAMDRAGVAEREARIAQDKFTYAQIELAKKGIYISTDGH